MIAAALGCATAFYYARFLGRELVANRFPGKVKKVELRKQYADFKLSD